uniref:Uncharacterized protein n=1 Tax=Romanomermis culicivorax TaxID=13658 RepID=A0A915JG58_ROMCU
NIKIQKHFSALRTEQVKGQLYFAVWHHIDLLYFTGAVWRLMSGCYTSRRMVVNDNKSLNMFREAQKCINKAYRGIVK